MPAWVPPVHLVEVVNKYLKMPASNLLFLMRKRQPSVTYGHFMLPPVVPLHGGALFAPLDVRSFRMLAYWDEMGVLARGPLEDM